MSTKQHIDWRVSAADALISPLGYRLELGETRGISPLLATHSTFERTGEFKVSVLGDGDFEEYPLHGLVGATERTIVRFLRNGESPLSTLAVAADSFLYKMSLDCKEIMQYRQVCETGTFSIDAIGSDRSGNLWVKDTSGTVTVLDRMLRTISTTRLDPLTVCVIPDPNRGFFWQVMPDSIKMVKSDDLSVTLDLGLPSTVVSVLAHDVSAPSGNLFLVTSDGLDGTSLAVTPSGSVIEVGLDASDVCQWGNRGAMFCSRTEPTIHIFDGTSVIDHFHTTLFGVSQPVRLAALGGGCFFVTDVDGSVSKVDSMLRLSWRFLADGLGDDVDVSVTPGIGEVGNVLYMFSRLGVSSVRDMGIEGWLYGGMRMPIPTGRLPSPFPVAPAMVPPPNAHVWARSVALPRDDVFTRESSSSSSLSTESSSSLSTPSSQSSPSTAWMSSSLSSSFSSMTTSSVSSVSSASSSSVSTESSLSSFSSSSSNSSSRSSYSSLSSGSSLSSPSSETSPSSIAGAYITVLSPVTDDVWDIFSPGWEVEWVGSGFAGNVDVAWHWGDGYSWQVAKVDAGVPNDGSHVFYFGKCVNGWVNKIVITASDDGRVSGESGRFHLGSCII